jgi:DNA-binding response OmpR family regulator
MQRILVCDDDGRTVRALRVVLRDAGFRVEAAASADDALDAAALRPPAAAIVELALPDADGVDLCRQLREWSAIPLIVLSAIDEEHHKVRALNAGADDYVTKPFAPRERGATRPSRAASCRPRHGAGAGAVASRACLVFGTISWRQLPAAIGEPIGAA